jgi:putative MFS transporter
MLLLIKWVPESPRHLIQTGHIDEARRIMAQIGVNVAALGQNAFKRSDEKHSFSELLAGPLRGTTAMLCLYGIAWGLCNWGFITYLPTMLRGIGMQPTVVSGVLATSALFAAPGTLVAAALYGFWSSKKSALLFAFGTGGTLILLGLGQAVIAAQPALLSIGLVALLTFSSSMLGVLTPYSVELFPTALRGVGSGVVTGSSKAGGLIGPPIVGAVLTITPGLLGPGLIIGVPMGLAGLLMLFRGRETRGRRLEELTAPTSPVAGY